MKQSEIRPFLSFSGLFKLVTNKDLFLVLSFLAEGPCVPGCVSVSPPREAGRSGSLASACGPVCCDTFLETLLDLLPCP